MAAPELVLDEGLLEKLGDKFASQWETYRTDRKAAEDRWLQNLRQYRGIYDPAIKNLIPKDRSVAYPKLTRWKVIGTVARLMQMLFPQTEENFAVAPSPLPNLSTAQLQQVLDELVASKTPEGGNPAEVECTDEEIEKAIFEFAKARSERMEVKIKDDMKEMEFITLARRVVFSAVLYNVGVLKGPMHDTYVVRTWKRDVNTGLYKAYETTKLKPLFEFLSVWNWYPDMTAKTVDQQDAQFERHVMIRAQVEALGERPDFIAANVTKWLETHKTGNWKPEHWETELKAEPKSDRQNTDDGAGRKYVVCARYGDVTGHDLAAAGVKIPEAELGKTFRGECWFIDRTVIKCRIALVGGQVPQHHTFIYEEDDLSLLGNGQCDTLRDSQLSICEMTRMLLDEASVGGENLEVNKDLLAPGVNHDIRSHKVWVREGDGAAAQIPAVRPVSRQSRLGDLINGVKLFMEYADKESGLPPPSMGDVSGGGSEALRTQQNASMFLGAAALPIRDTVRNYDSFTISVISALVKWNMRYDPNASRDGDYEIIARGSTSLIAKEVLSQSLDMFAATLTPEDKLRLNEEKLLKMRARARDIPIDELMKPKEEADADIAAYRESQSKVAAIQTEEIESKIRKNMADSFKAVAQGQAAGDATTLQAYEIIIEALTNGGQGKGAPASSAGAPA